MGLLLGGSVLTVFELMDLIIFNFFKKLARRSLQKMSLVPKADNKKQQPKANAKPPAPKPVDVPAKKEENEVSWPDPPPEVLVDNRGFANRIHN